MNGIRFYEEFKNKRRGISEGNVIAALVCNGVFVSERVACYEAISSVYWHANSAVAGCAVSLDYLRKKCKRVSEAHARKVHPALFERLDKP